MRLKADEQIFKDQIKLFVEHHRRLQNSPEFCEKRQDKTLVQLIDRAVKLTDKSVEVVFQTDHETQVSHKVVGEVHGKLKDMQNSINSLPAKKRFYLLETINFFSSRISIGKLIPALLVLEGEDQKKAICEFALPTFLSINKNVETLVANDDLFDPETLHIERGALYTLISDLAKVLIKLFNNDIVSSFGDMNTPIEFLMNAFHPGTFEISKKIKTDSHFIYEEMVEDDELIRDTALQFVTLIQSHEHLYNYAIKRHLYYKSFLMEMTGGDRFEKIDPIDISRILAGCLVQNGQLRPEDELIDNMIDELLFENEQTCQLKQAFIDQLAPSTVLKLINRFKTSLQHLSSEDYSDKFQDVQKMAVKTVLKSVWSGMVRLIDSGLSKASEPFIKALDFVKETYKSFVSEEKNDEKEEIEAVAGRTGTLTFRAGELIPKNLESFALMTQYYQIVEPDVIGIRGEHDGASHKDFGFNSRVFKQDERLLIQFYDCMQRLFAFLENNDKVKVITFEKQSKIREYAVSYQFGKYMISLGITHLRIPNSLIINEKDLFPYVLLFKEGTKKKFGRILAREVVVDGNLKLFNEFEFSASSSIFAYESLYLVLHLLPEKDWKSSEVQACVSFLLEELQRFKEANGRLLFCVNIPKEIS
jgi:hypothetical protein